ncbi:MAG TPA: tetratricopeptide repeat protein [Ignavibacteria bacterium]|nr:tetratricopeptide repeat protein [Ignavibacteria bacterium]
MKKIILLSVLFCAFYSLQSCNYITNRTISKSGSADTLDPEPNYEVSLNPDYQNFTNYIFMGNRMENFSTYFNVFYTATDDYNVALEEIRTSTISEYNRRLDSLNIVLPVSQNVKEKLNKTIERCSKVIQFHKNSKFLDDAVLLIGKSYYYLTDYLQAERKFSEFLSKLSASPLSDEAVLFLGRTKMKLGQISEAERILQKLLKESKNTEVISEAYQELALNELAKRNFSEAIKYFQNSINNTKDSERKSEKEYILAKIYNLFEPQKSANVYERVVNMTSDFDLSFFAKLNYGKSLIYNKQYDKAEEILEDLNSDYRDYPEYKQLAELELANNLYAEKDYNKGLDKYYEVIIKYPNTKASSDAYYHLARFYEDVKNDYLNALVNYRKAAEENSGGDYATISQKRADVLDRYFTLQAEANGTNKIQIPAYNSQLEYFRKIFDEDRGVIRDDKRNTDPNNPNNPPVDEEGPGPKGGGLNSINLDSNDNRRRGQQGDDGYMPEQNPEQVNEQINDTLKIPETNNPLDSTVSNVMDERTKKFNAYYELAEIFIFDIQNNDSAAYYLNILIKDFSDSPLKPKAIYTLATVYKNAGRDAEGNDLLNGLISEYPNSVFANESRKILGIKEVEIEKDAAEESYNLAAKSFNDRNYFDAVAKFQDVLAKYPNSGYVDNTLYSLGWIYENVYSNKDSTMLYYNRIIKDYANSDFAKDIKPRVDYYNSFGKDNTLIDTSRIPVDSIKTTFDSTNVINTKLPDGSDKPGDEPKLTPEEIEQLLKQEDQIVPDKNPGEDGNQ